VCELRTGDAASSSGSEWQQQEDMAVGDVLECLVCRWTFSGRAGAGRRQQLRSVCLGGDVPCSSDEVLETRGVTQ